MLSACISMQPGRLWPLTPHQHWRELTEHLGFFENGHKVWLKRAPVRLLENEIEEEAIVLESSVQLPFRFEALSAGSFSTWFWTTTVSCDPVGSPPSRSQAAVQLPRWIASETLSTRFWIGLCSSNGTAEKWEAQIESNVKMRMDGKQLTRVKLQGSEGVRE